MLKSLWNLSAEASPLGKELKPTKLLSVACPRASLGKIWGKSFTIGRHVSSLALLDGAEPYVGRASVLASRTSIKTAHPHRFPNESRRFGESILSLRWNERPRSRRLAGSLACPQSALARRGVCLFLLSLCVRVAVTSLTDMNTCPQKHPAGAQGRPERGSSKSLTVVVIALVALAAVATYFLQRERPPKAAASAAGAVTPPEATTVAGFQSLKGRWARPDGNYVLEIRAVDADGQVEAGYYNPQPIRVSKAEVKKDGAAIKVFVELNDINYPGCKYNLTYIPNGDQLAGTYFQAALQQTYEVVFERAQ